MQPSGTHADAVELHSILRYERLCGTVNLRDLNEPAFQATPLGHARLMVIKVLLLVLDVACLAVAVGAHKVVDLLSEWVIPPDWTYLSKFLVAVFAIAFSLIYIHLAWDMVLLFVPWLRGKGVQTAPAPTPEHHSDHGKHTIENGRAK